MTDDVSKHAVNTSSTAYAVPLPLKGKALLSAGIKFTASILAALTDKSGQRYNDRIFLRVVEFGQ